MNLAEHMQDLYTRFGTLPGITVELHKSLLGIGVRNQAASATVFLQGAQVTHYQRRGEPELIWSSPLCDFRPGTSLRGGIPVCWPWFGDLQRNPESVRSQISAAPAPAHGAVRGREWTLSAIRQPAPDLTELELTLSLSATCEPLWPFACDLTLLVRVGPQLQLDFTVTNRDSRAFTFTGALHTHFAVAAIEQTQVHGLDACTYIDTLDNWTRKSQQGAIGIAGEVDRIYLNVPPALSISDGGNQRQIRIDTTHSASAVVWNPWTDKALRLSCFPPTAYRDMVCVETGNMADNAVTLDPGASHCSSVCIR